MCELEKPSMKKVSRVPGKWWTRSVDEWLRAPSNCIQRITNKRMPGRGRVYTNLMGPPRYDPYID